MYVRRTVRQLTKVIIITKKTAATIAKQSVSPEAVPKEVASKGSRRMVTVAIFGYFGHFWEFFGFFDIFICLILAILAKMKL